MIPFLSTGGPRIVRILGSQEIVLLRNRTKQGLVLSTKNVLLERLFFEKNGKKPYYIGDRTK